MANRIALTDSILDVMSKLSAGNPGAINVLCLWKRDGPTIDPDACDPLIQMLSFDDMDIIGADIWMLYSDVAGKDLRVFIGILRAHQLGQLSTGELKQAIRDGRRHTLDIPALLAYVEHYLPHFQRSAQPQATNAIDPSAQLSGTPTPRAELSSSHSCGLPPSPDPQD